MAQAPEIALANSALISSSIAMAGVHCRSTLIQSVAPSEVTFVVGGKR